MKLDQLRRRVLVLTKSRVHELRIGADSRQQAVVIDEVGGNHLQSLCRRSLLQTATARVIRQLLSVMLCSLAGFLLPDERLDLRFHFVHRFNFGFLLVVHMNDVEAEAGLHEVAGAAFGQRKRSLLEFRDSHAFAGPSQRATELGAAGVVRILLGQVGKVAAGLHLLEHVFSLGAGCIHGLLINLAVGGR